MLGNLFDTILLFPFALFNTSLGSLCIHLQISAPSIQIELFKTTASPLTLVCSSSVVWGTHVGKTGLVQLEDERGGSTVPEDSTKNEPWGFVEAHEQTELLVYGLDPFPPGSV